MRRTCRFRPSEIVISNRADAGGLDRARDAGIPTEVVDHRGWPSRDDYDRALVEALRGAGGFDVQPKQAWTNVADFAARGLDAVNLGPGTTRLAHAVDERVEIGELVRTYEALQRFLTTASGSH